MQQIILILFYFVTGVAYYGSLMSARGREDMSRLNSRSVDEGLMITVQYYAKYRPKATKFNTISCFFSLVYRCLVNSLNDLKKIKITIDII